MRFLDLNLLCVCVCVCGCVVASHTWKCVDARGEGPEAREAHSATLVGKRIFIFGGCGKASGSDDEVFYNDLYILNTGTAPGCLFLCSLIWNLREILILVFSLRM